MTKAEQKCIDSLANAWNLFLELPVEHNDDLSDFRYSIHVLQRQIMARSVRRKVIK